MDIDLPEVVAEVRDAFALYEKALVSNDVPALNSLFRDDSRTIRYGAGEILYGHAEIKAFRAARSPVALGRTLSRTVITTLRPRLRGGLDAVRAAFRARQDRPADADLGEIPRRLARRGGARQFDRQANVIIRRLLERWPDHCRRSALQGDGYRLQRRDRRHFDQERFLHQPVDHQQRVGRIGAVGKHLGKFAQPEFHELRNVLRVHHVGGELDDIAPAGADRFQRRFDIGEGLGALRVEIVADRPCRPGRRRPGPR